MAAVFADVLDQIVHGKNDNIAMLGIFAPWGRGKSYFWSIINDYIGINNILREYTVKKNNDNPSKKISFTNIAFNAWKYQSAPGIWAHLFENIISISPFWVKFWYKLKRNFFSIFINFLLFSIPVCISYILDVKPAIITSAWLASSLGFLSTILSRELNSVSTIIDRFPSKTSFKKHLGLQYDIENELSALFKIWIPKRKIERKRILLYVDDIDRCNCEQIVQVIENIRAILENNEIRRRLVVICSIDSKILYSALKDKYSRIIEPNDLDTIIKAQFDKLFTSTVSLPNLLCGEYNEYFDSLSDYNQYSYSRIFLNYDITKEQCEKQYVMPTIPSENEVHGGLIDEKTIQQYIIQAIEKHRSIFLSPRQMDLIYRRCLFAASLFGIEERYLEEDSLVKLEETVEAIVIASYGDDVSTSDLLNANRKIVETVVPYPYIFDTK